MTTRARTSELLDGVWIWVLCGGLTAWGIAAGIDENRSYRLISRSDHTAVLEAPRHAGGTVFILSVGGALVVAALVTALSKEVGAPRTQSSRSSFAPACLGLPMLMLVLFGAVQTVSAERATR
jgi:hypothetical protein